jgi:hypothetical protein
MSWDGLGMDPSCVDRVCGDPILPQDGYVSLSLF